VSKTLVVLGTRKGLFLGWSADRLSWDWEGPHHAMAAVAAVAIDTRRTPPRLLAGGRNEHWGPAVFTSDDLGGSWSEASQGSIGFPPDTGADVEQVWQLQPGPPSRPDEVWAGVEPSALFRSVDGGSTYSLVRSLWDHPHRSDWRPGAGGQCLHTVLPHPDYAGQVLVAMSTGGVYVSDDDGATWSPSNAGISAPFLPDPQPEFGQCVHKVVRDTENPDLLMLQNHGGVFRSEDGGRSWASAEEGLPANFGFGMTRTPGVAGAFYCFPLSADLNRFPVGGQAGVYRSSDGGRSWTDASDGLPASGFQTVVLRDAMANDGGDPAGVYLGTRSGEVWASLDGGHSWDQLVSHLPDVLCVRAAVLP
jgi:BNR/Asp-box repeat